MGQSAMLRPVSASVVPGFTTKLSPRPELNGRIVSTPDGDLAIVMNGIAHFFENKHVIYALFGDHSIKPDCPIHDVPPGPTLNDGTCLIRAKGTVDIFLVTGLPRTRRHLISTYENFKAYGFEMTMVQEIPWLALQAVPVGPVI